MLILFVTRCPGTERLFVRALHESSARRIPPHIPTPLQLRVYVIFG